MIRKVTVFIHLTVAALLLACLPAARAQSATIRFAAIGDYGTNTQPELDVANQVKSWNPDFIITLGDNNYESGSSATIDANIGQYYSEYISPYIGKYGIGASDNRFFPCLGNHDWGNKYPNPKGAQPYLSYFGMPGNGRYYTFTRGPVQFFVLDSDNNEPDGNSSTSVQAVWLQKQLAASTARWKLVYFHHPPYSSGTIGSVTVMRWPFAEWGATAVLSAHAHDYERIDKNGFPYFVAGVGGKTLEPFAQYLTSGSKVRYCADFGAMLITASDAGILFQFITRTGVLIDNYAINAPAGPAAPAAPGSLAATVAASSQVNLSWADNSSNEDGFRIERSLDNNTFTQIATVGANVTSYPDTTATSNTYFYRVRAYNSTGNSAYSNTASASTAPPNAPSTLTATATSSSQINLSWIDNGSNESGFRVERSTDGTNFSEVAVVAANVTAYPDGSLNAATAYSYRVRSYNGLGNSAYSNVAGATTPTPPTSLTLTPVADTYVRDDTYANTNFGSDSTLYSRTTSSKGSNRDAYLKFSLAGVGSIAGAKLRIYAAPYSGALSSTTAYAVSNTSWTENGMTWNNRPALGAAMVRVSISGTAYAWYEFDVTSAVQAAKAAGTGFVSLALHNTGLDAQYIATNSKESGSNAPQLVIAAGP